MLRSEDRGKTFTRVLTTNDLGCTALTEGTMPGSYFAVSYTEDTLILHTSKDSGKTWTPQLLKWSTPQSAFDQSLKVAAIVQVPSGRLVFGIADSAPTFSTGTSGRLAYSDDGVTLIDTKSATSQVPTLASNGTQLLAFGDAVGDPDLWSSPDGATWTKNTFAFASPDYSPYLVLKYVPSRDAFLALGSERLLQSTRATYKFDGGQPLSRFFGLSWMRSVAADPFAASTWLLGTEVAGEGVFRRDSADTEWSLASGIESANVDVAYRDAKSGYVYAASLFGGRVWAGPSGANSLGVVWRSRDKPYAGAELTAVAYDHANPKHLVIALQRGSSLMPKLAELWEVADVTAVPVPKPGDSNQTWTQAPDPTKPVEALSISALFVDGALRLVGFQPRVTGPDPVPYLYRSMDGGKSYAPLSLLTTGAIWFVEQDPHDPQVFYVGAGAGSAVDPKTQGLFRSTNGGDTWTQLGPLPNVGDYQPHYIAFDPDDAKRFWVASTSRVWQTFDAGAVFTEIDVPGFERAVGLAYSAAQKRLLLAQATGVLGREISDTATWTRADNLSAAPNSLLANGEGVATDAGLFVTADIFGMPGVGMGGAPTAGGGAGGPGTSKGPTSSDGSSGCGCRVGSDSRTSPRLAALALALGLIAQRRVRRG